MRERERGGGRGREGERERERGREGERGRHTRTAKRALGVRSYEHRRREHVPLVSTLVLCQSERGLSEWRVIRKFFHRENF